jgi:hypothetical protein
MCKWRISPDRCQWKDCVKMYLKYGIFFATASRLAQGPTQPPIQWVQGFLSPWVRRPGREVDNSPPSSAEVKYPSSCTSSPPYVFMAWCLFKHRLHNANVNCMTDYKNCVFTHPYETVLNYGNIKIIFKTFQVIEVYTTDKFGEKRN